MGDCLICGFWLTVVVCNIVLSIFGSSNPFDQWQNISDLSKLYTSVLRRSWVICMVLACHIYRHKKVSSAIVLPAQLNMY